MKSRYLRIMALTFTLLVVVSVSAFPQKLSIIPSIGFSKDLRTETSNRWNIGPSVGFDMYWNVAPVIGVGFRTAFHYWGADADGWAEDYFGSGYYSSFNVSEVSASQIVFEFMPAARFAFTKADVPFKVSAQVGVGMVLVVRSDVEMKVTFTDYYYGGYSYGTDWTTVKGETLVGYGVQAGLPMLIANLIEVRPTGTFYLLEADPYFHFGLNVGVRLGK